MISENMVFKQHIFNEKKFSEIIGIFVCFFKSLVSGLLEDNYILQSVAVFNLLYRLVKKICFHADM